MINEDDPRVLLKNAGLKITRQREEILGLLLHSEHAQTAEELFFALKDTGHTFGLSTVYRTLASLETSRLIEKSELPDATSQCYSIAHEGHRHHLICTHCKKCVVLDECPVDCFASEIGEQQHFKITGHSFEIFGICPGCQAKENHQV